MNILLTGGSGDLGLILGRDLVQGGHHPTRMDIRPPKNPQHGRFISGSILDRETLRSSMQAIDCVVHIAAWHGIHLVTGQKNAYDFWDLNVTGTFNVFQAAAEQGIRKFIYISSTSIQDKFGIYGHTKLLGEEIAQVYHQRHQMEVITLRPGAFIPYWNRDVYKSFAEFALWYWKGAVHINDVAQAVTKSIDLLNAGPLEPYLSLYVDGKYEYTTQDLQNWDANGAGTTFLNYYADHAQTAARFGLDPTIKPDVFDIQPTRKWLGYEPTYSPLNLLEDLDSYAADGPPAPVF